MLDNSDFPVYSNYDSIDQVDRVMNYVDNKILDLLGLIAGKLDIVDRGITLTLGSIMKSIGTKVKKDLSNNSRMIARVTKKLDEGMPYETSILSPSQAVAEGVISSSPIDTNDIGIDSFIPSPRDNPFIPDPQPNPIDPIDPGTNPPEPPPEPKPEPKPEPPTEPPVNPPTNPPTTPTNPPSYDVCSIHGAGEPLLGFGTLPQLFCGSGNLTYTNVCGTLQTWSTNTISGDMARWLSWAFKSKDCFQYEPYTSTFYNRQLFLNNGNSTTVDVAYSISIPYQRNTIENLSPYTDEGENALWERYNQDTMYRNIATYGSYNELVETYAVSSVFASEQYTYQTLANHIGNYV